MTKHEVAAPEKEAEVAPTHVVIDGLEGDLARVELPDGRTVDWDRDALPEGAREGDVIRIEGQGEHQRFVIDHAETRRRRGSAQTQLDAVNAEQPTGEIEL